MADYSAADDQIVRGMHARDADELLREALTALDAAHEHVDESDRERLEVIRSEITDMVVRYRAIGDAL